MPSASFNPRVPFLRAAGEAAGISPTQFQAKGLRQVVRGVHVDASVVVDTTLQARAALLIAPNNSAASRHTAAKMWGGIVPDDWHTHVTTFWPKADERREQARARARARGGGAGCTTAARRLLEWGRMDVDGVDSRVSSDPWGVVTLRGVRVTSPLRTFLDLAEDLDLVELVVLGDSLVRTTTLTPGQLVAGAATPGRHRRHARRAASLVRAGVDSAPETRVRLLLVLAGLPEPEVNIVIYDHDGVVLRRIDLGYRRQKVGVEYDGRHHAHNEEQWAADITRREDFDDWSWRLVTVISPGLWKEPSTTLRRVCHALRQRGLTVQVTSDEWKRYFGRQFGKTA